MEEKSGVGSSVSPDRQVLPVSVCLGPDVCASVCCLDHAGLCARLWGPCLRKVSSIQPCVFQLSSLLQEFVCCCCFLQKHHLLH